MMGLRYISISARIFFIEKNSVWPKDVAGVSVVSEVNVCVGTPAAWVAVQLHCTPVAGQPCSLGLLVGITPTISVLGLPVSFTANTDLCCVYGEGSLLPPAWGYAWCTLGRIWPLQPVLDVAF